MHAETCTRLDASLVSANVTIARRAPIKRCLNDMGRRDIATGPGTENALLAAATVNPRAAARRLQANEQERDRGAAASREETVGRPLLLHGGDQPVVVVRNPVRARDLDAELVTLVGGHPRRDDERRPVRRARPEFRAVDPY
jgi:hypothetical protein